MSLSNRLITFCIPVIFSVLAISPNINAENLSGLQIMKNVNARDDGQRVSREFTIKTIDRRGIERVEKTKGYRAYYDDGKKTVIFYTEPTNVRGTAFLTFDYLDAEKDDDQWLYLPALRKVRRISASNRGDAFLGTDLSYEEIKKENKVELNDYIFTYIKESECLGKPGQIVEAKPMTTEIAKEIGYSRIQYCIDPDIWMAKEIQFWDVANNSLKTLQNLKVEQIDSIWTATSIKVVNHKTNHQTFLSLNNVDYQADVNPRVFTQQNLARGLR